MDSTLGTTSIVQDLKADNEPELTEIESLCMNCHENGQTRILITRIAFFREIIVSSFECPHCGHSDRSIDAAAEIKDQGQRITLNVTSRNDLNRRIVRPANSAVDIPSLDAHFECRQGDLTTIEGVISGAIENIRMLQPERRKIYPKQADLLDAFITKLESLLLVDSPFILILDDPSGNGFIEKLLTPAVDPKISIQQYNRTEEQDTMLGISHIPIGGEATRDAVPADVNKAVTNDEVMDFRHVCPKCGHNTVTHMKLVDIPHFKQVVVMSGVCDNCGQRETEVKSGSGIEPRGRRYRLVISRIEDLSRDVIFSETAVISLPDIDLESESGSLGGRFSTVEGVIRAVRDQLIIGNPFAMGDSASGSPEATKFSTILAEMENMASGKQTGVIFEIIDPAGNSYVQDLYVPEVDPYLTVEDYTRSTEEDDLLGLLDMKTDNY